VQHHLLYSGEASRDLTPSFLCLPACCQGGWLRQNSRHATLLYMADLSYMSQAVPELSLWFASLLRDVARQYSPQQTCLSWAVICLTSIYARTICHVLSNAAKAPKLLQRLPNASSLGSRPAQCEKMPTRPSLQSSPRRSRTKASRTRNPANTGKCNKTDRLTPWIVPMPRLHQPII
jgi:hypothetical protein